MSVGDVAGIVNAALALVALVIALLAMVYARDSARVAKESAAAADETLRNLREASEGIGNLLTTARTAAAMTEQSLTAARATAAELGISINLMRAIRKADRSTRRRDHLEDLGGHLTRLGTAIAALDQAELGPLRAGIRDVRTALQVALLGLRDDALPACSRLAACSDVEEIRSYFAPAWAEFSTLLERSGSVLAADEEIITGPDRPGPVHIIEPEKPNT